MGCPAATGTRTIAPENWFIASGLPVFLMKFEFAATVGQGCHPIWDGSINWPRLRSTLATNTSTVSIAGVATGAGASGS